jgi:hypothetical protein
MSPRTSLAQLKNFRMTERMSCFVTLPMRFAPRGRDSR